MSLFHNFIINIYFRYRWICDNFVSDTFSHWIGFPSNNYSGFFGLYLSALYDNFKSCLKYCFFLYLGFLIDLKFLNPVPLLFHYLSWYYTQNLRCSGKEDKSLTAEKQDMTNFSRICVYDNPTYPKER